jgi:hypothetical protein
MARDVSWERLERLSPKDAVVTGDEAEPENEAENAAEAPSVDERILDPLLSRPLIVFVHDDPELCDGKCAGACQRYFDIEAQVFGREKILLAMRAFRPIRMTGEQAKAEPLLADVEPAAVPRLVFLDVARGRTVVLDGSRAKASRVYGEMKKMASVFYRERLDTVVKKHQKILGQHDKLAQEEFRVREQQSLTTDERRAKKLEKQLDEIKEEQEELDRKVDDLWDLTIKPL